MDKQGDQRGETPDMLDQLLAEARETELPAALEARMLADARQVQDGLVPPAVLVRPGPLVRLRTALGGWAPMGGLVATGLVGVWIGMAPPAIAGDPVGRLIEARQGLDIFDPDDLSGFVTDEVQ